MHFDNSIAPGPCRRASGGVLAATLQVALLLLAFGELGCARPHDEAATASDRTPSTPLKLAGEPARRYYFQRHDLDMYGLAVTDKGDRGWAVGENGTLWQLSEDRWSLDYEASRVTNSDLEAVWINPEGTHGWAVGEGGTLLRWAAGRWSRYTTKFPFYQHLFGLWMNREGTHGWAVGEAGTVLRWSDSTWALYPLSPGTTKNLFDLWMNDEGTVGWAVGSSGTILHWSDGSWTKSALPTDWQHPAATVQPLAAVATDDQGSRGWAFGHEGRAKWADTQWSVPLHDTWESGPDITDLWVDPTAKAGWAVGDRILRLKDDQWIADLDSDQPHHQLWALWIDKSGTRGWAVGASSTVFRLSHTGWSRDPETMVVADLTGFLEALWLDSNGASGWAMGPNTVVRFADGRWHVDEHTQGVLLNAFPNSLWFTEDGLRGWALGAYAVFRYTGGKWSRDPQATQAIDLTPPEYALQLLEMNPKGTHGWIAGTGLVLKWSDGTWSNDPAATRAFEGSSINALRIDESGEEGWAVSEDGIYKLSKGRWSKDASAALRGRGAEFLWIDDQGHSGWAGGPSGMLRLTPDGWQKDLTAPRLTSRDHVHAVWIDDSGCDGWAMGVRALHLMDGQWTVDERVREALDGHHINALSMEDRGHSGWGVGSDILRIDSTAHTPALRLQRGSLETLEATLALTCPEGFSCSLELAQGGAATDLPSNGPHLEVVKSEERVQTLNLHAPDLLRDQVEARLQVVLTPNHPADTPSTFQTEPFTVATGARSIWTHAATGLAGVLLLNLLLVLAGMRSGAVRRLLLHKVGAQLVGLVLGKYVVVNGALRFVSPIRLAWFIDYRIQLANAASLAHWNRAPFAPPHLRGIATPEAAPDTTPDTQRPQYLRVLDEVLQAPLGKLWLVRGPSGQGKTALLENWTRALLERGRTPFLIRLGSDLDLSQEAAALMTTYGEIPVDAAGARDLLEAGGFVVLLDALNEDQHEGTTRELVRRLVKRNVVIVSSQRQPNWPRDLEFRELVLDPFGEAQLQTFLAPEWVAKLREQPLLFEEAGLPQVALLLSEYIDQHNHLPAMRLDLFESLRAQLDVKLTQDGYPGQVLHLEAAAWDLFRHNGIGLTPDGHLTEALCADAQAAGLLTRADGKYRFRHERIQRFMVACDRARHTAPPYITCKHLQQWHDEVDPRLARAHWLDVCDFLTERCAREAPQAYPHLLLEIARFSPEIFTSRLKVQAERLQAAGKVYLDRDYYRETILLDSGYEAAPSPPTHDRPEPTKSGPAPKPGTTAGTTAKKKTGPERG